MQIGESNPLCARAWIETVKAEFEKENYQLLSDSYVNSSTKLDYICPKNHQHSISWNNWKTGKRCPYCAGVVKPTIDFIKKEFKKENYTLLTEVYSNCKQKLNYICKNGHRHSICWSSWKAGKRCAQCAGNARVDIKRIKVSFEKEGYIVLSDSYVNAHTKLQYKCPNGHINTITWSNWNNKKKYRCPDCSNKISKQEIEVRDFIMSLDFNIQMVFNDRTIIFNSITGKFLELDIWFPELKKAIEFNGEYWHSFENSTICDRLKKNVCDDLGIDLLIIKYKEWINDTSVCKLNIIKFINNNK